MFLHLYYISDLFISKEKQNSHPFKLLDLHSNLGPEAFHDLISLSASSEGEYVTLDRTKGLLQNTL